MIIDLNSSPISDSFNSFIKYTLSAFYTLQSSGGYKDKKPSSLPLRDAPFSREACKHAKGVIKIQRGNACNKEQYMALDIHPTNVSYY